MFVERVETLQETAGLHSALSQTRPAGPARILLVEDEAFVREVTCEVLRAAGFEVLTARNATEATQALDGQSGNIDLLLTDMILPGENGRVLAERLRRENSGLKVLFVTGYAEHIGMSRSESSDWLAKPFSSDALLARVRYLLDTPGTWSEDVAMTRLVCDNA